MRRLPSLEIAFQAILALTIALVAFIQQAQAQSKYAAMVVDGYTGKVVYARNANARRYPASLTKVMTLYILFQELDAGRLTKATRLRVSKRASRQPPSKLGLKAGSTISVDNAIRALAVKSANDIAVTIAERISGTEKAFARRMTRTARKLGMSRTQFRNASGLPNKSQWTTARDMITLARRMMKDHPNYYPYFSVKKFTWRGRTYTNYNKLLGRYKGVTGIKTGYTRASGFNLTAAVQRGGKQVVAVVMGGKTGRRRNAEMRRLLDKALPLVVTRAIPKTPKAPPRAFARLAPASPRIKPALFAAATPRPAAPGKQRLGVVQLALMQLPARNRELPLAAATARPHPNRRQIATNSPAIATNSTIASLVNTTNTLFPRRSLYGSSPTSERSRRLASLGGVQPVAYAATARTELATISIEQLILASRAVVAKQSNELKVAAISTPAPAPKRRVKRSRIVRPASAVVDPAGFTEVAGPDPAARSKKRRALFAAGAAAEGTVVEPPAAPPAPVAASATGRAQPTPTLNLPTGWQIQVGAYAVKDDAEARLSKVRKAAGRALARAMGFAIEVQKPSGTIYRARFAGLKRGTARRACRTLKKRRIDCLVLAN